METQTKIGIGATAVVAVLALLEPHMPTALAIPVYGLLLIVAVWGLAPLFAPGPLFSALALPIDRAAERALRAAGRAGLAGVAYDRHSPTTAQLQQIGDTLVAARIRLYGRKVPLRRLELIPQSERGALRLDTAANEFKSVPEGQTRYRDVAVDRFDLWRYLRRLRAIGQASG